MPIIVEKGEEVTALEWLTKIDTWRIGDASANSPSFFSADKVSEMKNKRKDALEYINAVKIITNEKDGNLNNFEQLLDRYKLATRFSDGSYEKPIARLRFACKREK